MFHFEYFPKKKYISGDDEADEADDDDDDDEELFTAVRLWWESMGAPHLGISSYTPSIAAMPKLFSLLLVEDDVIFHFENRQFWAISEVFRKTKLS